MAVALEFGAALHGSPFAGITASAISLSRASDAESLQTLTSVLAGRHVPTFGRLEPGQQIARLIDGAFESDSMLLFDPSTNEVLHITDPSAWKHGMARHDFDVSRSCADVIVDVSAGRRLPYSPMANSLHRLILAADTIGGMERMIDQTVAYAKERLAFGRPIGAFQAVQHRLVDHAVTARGMRLLAFEAGRQVSDGSTDSERAIALAEVAVSAGAGPILHDLVQLTGAIGFTWEYGLHLYGRRAHQNARLASNPRSSLQDVATIEGWRHVG